VAESIDNFSYERTFQRLNRRLRRLWKYYLKWPAPLWKLRGYAKLRLAGFDFKFPIANENLWWARRVRQDKWERTVREFLKEALRPGDVFFDVGAWIGAYTLLAAKLVEPRGWVYSFEPDPVARRMLEKALAANRISNVTVLPYAVTGREGSAWLEALELGASESTVSQKEGSIKIQTVTLKGFCEKHRVYPSAIKVNAMGEEPQIVADAIDILRRTRVVLLTFEDKLLRRVGADPSAFFQSLFDLQRRIIVLHQKHREGPQAGTELTPEATATGYMKLLLLEESA